MEVTNAVTILSISPYLEDHAALRNILKVTNWKVRCVSSCRAAWAFLRRNRPPLVLCERSLPDGMWKQLLDQLAQRPDRPCLVVTSRLADDHLWAEVLNLGGYDVLAKPFHADELLRVATLAVAHWNTEMERQLPSPKPAEEQVRYKVAGSADSV